MDYASLSPLLLRHAGKEHAKAWATQYPNMTKHPPTVHPDKPVGNNKQKPSANLVGTAQAMSDKAKEV